MLAHQHDLVYGHLSSESIFLTPAGETCLLPFCSSALDTSAARAALPPAYRSPGSEASRLSDQYGLAGLVQQLLLEQGSLPEDAPVLQQAIARAQSQKPRDRFERLRDFLGEVGIPLHLAEHEKEFAVPPHSEQGTAETAGIQPSARFFRRSGKAAPPRRFSLAHVLAIFSLLILIGGSALSVIVRKNQVATQAAQSTSTAATSTAFTGIATANAQAGLATAQAQVTATASALAPLNPNPSFKTLAYHDPMTADSGNWDAGQALVGGGDCSFQEDGFHVTAPPTTPDSENLIYLPKCQLHNKAFADFSFVIHMKISSGHCGVVTFEDYSTSGLHLVYEVYVCQDGTYSIVGDPGSAVGDNSRAIKRGSDQTNAVAIVTHGSTFTLFINKQRIMSVPVETLQSSFHSIKMSFSHCLIALSITGGNE